MVDAILGKENYAMQTNKGEWLIWSIQHGMWWRPDRRGYTASRAQAGRYTFEEACTEVEMSNRRMENAPDEAMVRVTEEDLK